MARLSNWVKLMPHMKPDACFVCGYEAERGSVLVGHDHQLLTLCDQSQCRGAFVYLVLDSFMDGKNWSGTTEQEKANQKEDWMKFTDVAFQNKQYSRHK